MARSSNIKYTASPCGLFATVTTVTDSCGTQSFQMDLSDYLALMADKVRLYVGIYGSNPDPVPLISPRFTDESKGLRRNVPQTLTRYLVGKGAYCHSGNLLDCRRINICPKNGTPPTIVHYNGQYTAFVAHEGTYLPLGPFERRIDAEGALLDIKEMFHELVTEMQATIPKAPLFAGMQTVSNKDL